MSILMFRAGQCAFSQISDNLKLVSWILRYAHCTQTASTFTRSQSIGAPLNVVELQICIMDPQLTNAAALWCCDVNIDKTSAEFFSALLNRCHKELRQFWRPKVIQPSTCKVHQLSNTLLRELQWLAHTQNKVRTHWSAILHCVFMKCLVLSTLFIGILVKGLYFELTCPLQ